MPRGVEGTGHWAGASSGISYWVEDPAEPPKPPKVKRTTNKFGGPRGTKKDAQGRGPKERAGTKTPQPPGTGGSGESAISAQKAERVARAAAIAAKQAKVARKQAKRLAKIEAKVDKAQKDAQALIDANNQKIAALTQQRAVAAKSGNPAAVRGLSKAIDALLSQNAGFAAKGADAQAGIARSLANDKLQADTVADGEKLTPEQKRRRRWRDRKNKDDIIEQSTIPSLATVRFGEKRPGDLGYAKNIKRAKEDVESYYLAHPDRFDPKVNLLLTTALTKHQTAVRDDHEDAVARGEKLIAKLKKTEPGSPAYNKLVKRIEKISDEYDAAGLPQQLNFLYGKDASSNVKGTKRKKPRGFIQEFVASQDRIYDAAQQFQNDVMFGANLGGRIRGAIAQGTAAVFIKRAEDSVHEIPDPKAPGGKRVQSTQERLVEMLAERNGNVSEEEAKELGQNRVIDYRQEGLAWMRDPVMKYLVPLLVEHGVDTNLDLTSNTGQAKLEQKIIAPGVSAAQDAWLENPDNYKPQGVDEGVYDYSRYGRDDDGEWFMLSDGTIVRPGDPIPEGHTEPRWNHGPDQSKALWDRVDLFNLSGSDDLFATPLEAQQEKDTKLAKRRGLQDIEDQVREAFKVKDPGFMGDLQATKVVGAGVDLLMGIGGFWAGAVDLMAPGGLGINVSQDWLQGEHVSTLETETMWEGIEGLDQSRSTLEQVSDLVSTSVTQGTSGKVQKFGTEQGYQPVEMPPGEGLVHNVLDFIFDTKTTAVGRTNPETGQTEGAVSWVYNLGMGINFEVITVQNQEEEEREALVRSDFAESVETGDPFLFGRVVGTNQAVQFGGAAGLINFAIEMVTDPTNVFPFAAVAKGGLRAVKAGVKAGLKVDGSLASLANVVDAMRGAARIDPTNLRLANLKKFIDDVAPQASPDEVNGALKRAVANMDQSLKGDSAINDLAKQIDKQFALSKRGFDPIQIRQMAAEQFQAVIENRGWIIHSQSDEIALALEKAGTNAQWEKHVAETQLGHILGERNKAIVDEAAAIGAQGRRSGGEVRAASEAFEAEALKIADEIPLSKLEDMVTESGLSKSRQAVLNRAQELSRARIGIVKGAVTAKGAKGRIVLDEAAFKGADRKPKLTRVQKDEALAAADKVRAKKNLAAREARAAKRRTAEVDAARVRAAQAPPQGVVSPRLHSAVQWFEQKVADLPTGFLKPLDPTWASKTGPRFWDDAMSAGLTANRTMLRNGNDAVNFVQSVVERFGKWDHTVAPRKAITNRGVSRVLRAENGIDGANGRAMYAAYIKAAPGFPPGGKLNRAGDAITDVDTGQIIKLADTDAPSFADFQKMWKTRGNKNATTVYGPEIQDAYEEALALGRISAESSYEQTLQFTLRQQFHPNAGADEALRYLDSMAKWGEDAQFSNQYVRMFFADEINTFHAQVGEAVVRFGRDVDDIFDASIGRLALRLDGPAQDLSERVVRTGMPAPRGADDLVGLREMDIESMVRRTLLDPEDLGNVQATAHVLTVAHLTGDQWKASAAAAAAFSNVSRGSNVGKAARALREQMAKEMDAMGFAGPGSVDDAAQGLVSPQRVAAQQHAAFINEMGTSEASWLLARKKRNMARINNAKTTKGERQFLLAENVKVQNSLDDIVVRKNGGTYKIPRTTQEDALKGAESVRSKVKDIFPPKVHAYFARTIDQAKVELARAIRVSLKNAEVSDVRNVDLDDFMEWFPIGRYAELNDRVGAAIRKVQGKRESTFGLRRPVGKEEMPDNALRTLTDGHPDLIKAKRDALDLFARENGLDEIPTEMYDRLRTLLQPHQSRFNRTQNLIAATDGASDETFLGTRALAAEQDGVDNIAWMLRDNPGMSADEAADQLKLYHYKDGRISPPPKQLDASDAEVLGKYFEELTGSGVDDIEGVKSAMSAHGTKPNFDKKFSFRDHQTRTGEWSPRAAKDVDETRPAWSLEEESKWFMDRYGEAPAWVTDPEIVSGRAFRNRQAQFEALERVGNFDERVRIQRALKEEGPSSIEDVAHGNIKMGIKPVKDTARERLWNVQRYGDRVGTIDKETGAVTLTNMPWLMNLDELGEYAMRGVDDAGEVFFKADEVVALREAIAGVVQKYADDFEAALSVVDDSYKVVPSSAVHEYAYQMMLELGSSQPWRKAYQWFDNNHLFSGWAALWTGLITGNPAWIVSNMVDNPTKALFFAVTNPFSRRASATAKQAIRSLDDLGIGATAYFDEITERGIHTRLGVGRKGRFGVQRTTTSYGKSDALRGLWDLATIRPLSKKLVSSPEAIAKTKLAQRIYTGFEDELVPGLRAMGLNDEGVKLALLKATKDDINKLFPILQNAGPAQKMLNKVLPFVSYNFKNKVLWITEIMDHPWLVYVVDHAKDGLIEYNERSYRERHPDATILPEYLFSQIRIPGTDITLDLGMFSDSVRGGLPLWQEQTVGSIIKAGFRPLPSQTAALTSAGWHLFGAFGRQRWEKVLNEDGTWSGDLKMVTVPPGTPWGDGGFDVFKDLAWPASVIGAINKAVEAGTWGLSDFVRIIGSIASFGEFAEPSRYFMANQQYRIMYDTDPDMARDWLNDTPEGQYLKSMWDARFYQPTHTGIDPAILGMINQEGPLPNAMDPKTIRKAWFMQQSPEYRASLGDAWEETKWADEYWDEQFDQTMTDAERERLSLLRRTWYTQFYHKNPRVWEYIGMGMTDGEWTDDVSKMHLEDSVTRFYAVYDWSLRPEDDKDAALWEKDREKYLMQNPEVLKFFEESKSQYDQNVQDVNDAWDTAFDALEDIRALREEAWEIDDPRAAAALSELGDLFDNSFNWESFGVDKDAASGVRVGPDLLGKSIRKVLRQGGDEKEAWYSQRMQAANEKAGDQRDKWFSIMDQNPDLKALYFERHPEKAVSWKRDKQYAQFWGRFSRLADKGNWDAAWDSWDDSSQWIKDRYRESSPSKYRDFVQSYQYQNYMGRWIAFFDRGDKRGAYAYFDSLPQWVKDKYFANHPGSKMNSGQGSAYVSMLNTMFDQIDAGNWDAAEKLWNAAPAWMRRRYRANNPSSTLFNGKAKGGWSDAKYKTYIRAMKKWVDLMRNGEDGEADKYFKSLPKWMQDSYLKRHPDKALLKETIKMQTLLQEYFSANKASQRAMLENNPALAKWLQQNSTKAARINAIMFIYSRLPDDPWLKRVFREKYPDIFSKEAQGEKKKQQIQDILDDNPEMRPLWQKWLNDINMTLAEAEKYALKAPKQVVVDHEYQRKSSHAGMSAAEVGEQIDELVKHEDEQTLREPRIV